ncbi:hypothetical protein ACLOJK_003756 [Asimina triloba]
MLVIGLHIVGALNTVLSAEHQRELRRYIYNYQNADGGWGFHTEGHSIMFSTALFYVALRLLGEEADGGEDGAMMKARKWVLDRGGATAIPSWGKMWLSIGEPILKTWPFCKLREKALSVAMQHIHYEDENTSYICTSAVNKGTDGCQSWDTAFAIQAIVSSNLIKEYSSTLEKAHDFIKMSQVHGLSPPGIMDDKFQTPRLRD